MARESHLIPGTRLRAAPVPPPQPGAVPQLGAERGGRFWLPGFRFARPSPARCMAARDCTFGTPASVGQSSRVGSSAVLRQVCGHQPTPGPLTACFQLQLEQTGLHATGPCHAGPTATVPCGRTAAQPHGASPAGWAPPGCGISHRIPFPVISSVSLDIHLQTPVCRWGSLPTALAAPAVSHRDAGSMGTGWTLPATGNLTAAQPSKPPRGVSLPTPPEHPSHP